jgi:hypothetical protein
LSDVPLHRDLVAATTTTAVDKIAIRADAGVLAFGCVALVALAVTVAERVAAPFARNFAVVIALDGFALVAHAVAVALEFLALGAANQITSVETTTEGGVEVARSVQADVVRHNVKSVPSQQQDENQCVVNTIYYI